MTGNQPYDRSFYDTVNDAGAVSAAAILPILLDLLPAKSAIDIGCGTGIWAAELVRLGVPDIIGVDGGYVPNDQRRLPPERFREADLTGPLGIGRKFDLALCLEVGEHLPAASADHLVSELVSLAPALLFSAATPGQGGTHHVNEQWPDYWIRRFEQHGHTCWDAIRPQIRHQPDVAWIYRQNVMVVLGPGHPALERIPVASRLTPPAPGDVAFEYVARYILEREDGLAATARRLRGLVARRLRRR